MVNISYHKLCHYRADLYLRNIVEAVPPVYEGFYNFNKVCLQFFIFLNVIFSRLFYDNITFRHPFIIIKCPAELNFDCKVLIRSVPSTFVTGLLSRSYVFETWPKPTPSCMRSETNNNALSNLSYNG